MNMIQNTELNEWDGYVFENTKEDIKQRFEITGLDSLNWAFRKLSALKAKEEEITNLAKAEKERIEFWEKEQKKSIQSDVEFFEGLINQYHAKVLQEDPKAKTLSTPYGTSKARATKAQPDKKDEKAILQHVIDNGMDEYIKPTLKWGDLKKSLKIAEIDGREVAVDENGQIVAGVEIKPETITYKVEAK